MPNKHGTEKWWVFYLTMRIFSSISRHKRDAHQQLLNDCIYKKLHNVISMKFKKLSFCHQSPSTVSLQWGCLHLSFTLHVFHTVVPLSWWNTGYFHLLGASKNPHLSWEPLDPWPWGTNHCSTSKYWTDKQSLKMCCSSSIMCPTVRHQLQAATQHLNLHHVEHYATLSPAPGQFSLVLN